MNRVFAGLLTIAAVVGVAAAQSAPVVKAVNVSRQSCQSGHWSTDPTLGWSVICIDCVIGGPGATDGGQVFSFNRTYCVDAGTLPSGLSDIADAGFTADGY